jgi:hypothetical protein
VVKRVNKPSSSRSFLLFLFFLLLLLFLLLFLHLQGKVSRRNVVLRVSIMVLLIVRIEGIEGKAKP